MLFRGENSGVGFWVLVLSSPSLPLNVPPFLPQGTQPAHLFFLSQMRFDVLGFAPLEKTNMGEFCCDGLKRERISVVFFFHSLDEIFVGAEIVVGR